MNAVVRDVRFDITARDMSRNAWESARKGGQEFSSVLVTSRKRADEARLGYDRMSGSLRKYESIQSRINATAGINGRGGAGLASGMFREMDQLRAKINPTFAAIQRYKTAILEINNAQRVGAISTAEASAAIGRHRTETLASLAAIKSRNTYLKTGNAVTMRSGQAIKLNNGQLQNLSYQLNDIGVMMASGQNPFVMMMQQGMQIGQIFGPGAGVLGAMRAVGTGIVTFVTNPINLAVVGVAALAGGVGYLWDAISGPEAATAEETLKLHSEWVSSLKNDYKHAADEAKKYVVAAESVSRPVAIAGALDDQKRLQDQLEITREKLRDIFEAQSTILDHSGKNSKVCMMMFKKVLGQLWNSRT